MNFHEGDLVMHWTFGLGKVVRLEERNMSGGNIMYCAVQVNDMTVWVPKDDRMETSLRYPTPENEFRKLLTILSTPGDPLPDGRHERKTMLTEILKDGSAESLCRVIRRLVTYSKVRPLNESDQATLKRAKKALIGEWGVALSITPMQAEADMYNLLQSGSSGD